MTPEEIWDAIYLVGFDREDSEAIFANAIREEREACAKVVEDWAKHTWPTDTDGEAEAIAAAIRSRTWPSYVPPSKKVSERERAARIIEQAQIFHCWGDRDIDGLDVQKRLASAIRDTGKGEG